MKMNPNSLDDKTKIIYGNELVLIGFAALLLVAAVQPNLNNQEAEATPVKVNTPATEEVILNTAADQAPQKMHEIDTRTTALYSDSQNSLPVAFPAQPQTQKLVN